jgi:hypothetical protein
MTTKGGIVPEKAKTKRRSLRVRAAAAQVAVAASELTGHPVDPRVKELAELGDKLDNPPR